MCVVSEKAARTLLYVCVRVPYACRSDLPYCWLPSLPRSRPPAGKAHGTKRLPVAGVRGGVEAKVGVAGLGWAGGVWAGLVGSGTEWGLAG